MNVYTFEEIQQATPDDVLKYRVVAFDSETRNIHQAYEGDSKDEAHQY